MDLLTYINDLPEPLVAALAFLLSLVPYLEAYVGAPVGVIGGLPLGFAILLAVVGNVISMLLFVFLGEKIRRKRNTGKQPESRKQEKLRRRFDRYGIIPVSLFGQLLLPSQITAGAMVSFGAGRSKVILWQCISITLWGAGFGFGAYALLSAVA